MTWFAELFNTILSIIPRLHHIPATHGGVLFGRNGKVKELEAGNRWYWPLIHSVYSYPVVRTTMNLPMQTVWMARRQRSYCAGAAISYEVDDVIAAHAESYDIEEVISDVVSIVVTEVISGWFTGGAVALAHAVTIASRRKLKTFGVRILKVGFTDFSPIRVYRLIGNEVGGE